MTGNEQPRFLLLLPPAPSPPTLPSLKAAFGDTLSQVLKEVSTHGADSSKAAILEIALACPHLASQPGAPRASVYDDTQVLLAEIYKLVCVIAAQEDIDIEDRDGVDVRVLLLAWSSEESIAKPQRLPYSSVADLEMLASSGRQWQYAFGVESEDGEAMVKAFVAAKGSGANISRVQGGPVMDRDSSITRPEASREQDSHTESHTAGRIHHHVAVGGTFDHLHIGHKLLLAMTVFTVDDAAADDNGKTERSATIGITGDQLLKNKKHAQVLESWEDRQRTVAAFVDSIVNFSPHEPRVTQRDEPGPNGKSVDLHYPNGLVVKCTEIQDPLGPTITEEHISALIISGETRSGGKAVNDKRKAKGWGELEVFEVEVLNADEDGSAKESFASKISSTAIREKLVRKAGGSKTA